MAPGLLAFLQASFFFFKNSLHEVGLFCFINELASNKNLDLDFPNETHLNFLQNPLHRDLARI